MCRSFILLFDEFFEVRDKRMLVDTSGETELILNSNFALASIGVIKSQCSNFPVMFAFSIPSNETGLLPSTFNR